MHSPGPLWPLSLISTGAGDVSAFYPSLKSVTAAIGSLPPFPPSPLAPTSTPATHPPRAADWSGIVWETSGTQSIGSLTKLPFAWKMKARPTWLHSAGDVLLLCVFLCRLVQGEKKVCAEWSVKEEFSASVFVRGCRRQSGQIIEVRCMSPLSWSLKSLGGRSLLHMDADETESIRFSGSVLITAC